MPPSAFQLVPAAPSGAPPTASLRTSAFCPRRGLGCTTAQQHSATTPTAVLQKAPPKEPGVGAAAATTTDFAAGFESVEESPEPRQLPVRGRLPDFLQGNLYRIGPGIFDLVHADGAAADRAHWFDGIGVAFKFELDARANRVIFMSRTVCPGAVRAIEATPKAAFKELKIGGKRGIPREPLAAIAHLLRPLTRDPQSGEVPCNLNVSLEAIPGRGALVARSDLSYNLALDAHSLLPRGGFSFRDVHPALRGVAAAAHSAVDAATGEVFNFVGGDWAAPGRLRVFRVRPDGCGDVLAEIDGASQSVHVHSVALTANFVVLAVAPWRVDLVGVLAEGALAPHLRLDTRAAATFYVVSRAERRVVGEFRAPPCLVFHYVNAFEAEGDLHLDACEYKDAAIINQFYMADMRTRPARWFSQVSPVRWTLPGVGKRARGAPAVRAAARRQALLDERLELPCVAPSVQGRAYRFAYGVSHDPAHDALLSNALVKLDVRTGERRSWSGPRCCVGEPTFVPAPCAAREDDGVLISVVVDAGCRKSFLLVLCARTMQEICRADAPQVIPHAFHGLYIPEDELP